MTPKGYIKMGATLAPYSVKTAMFTPAKTRISKFV